MYLINFADYRDATVFLIRNQTVIVMVTMTYFIFYSIALVCPSIGGFSGEELEGNWWNATCLSFIIFLIHAQYYKRRIEI